MEQVLELQRAALRLRTMAHDADLPGYAGMMIHAAEDLEQRASERALLRGFDVPLPISAEIH